MILLPLIWSFSFVIHVWSFPPGVMDKSGESATARANRFRFNEIALARTEFFFEFTAASSQGGAEITLTDGMLGHFLRIMEDDPLKIVLFADLGADCMSFTRAKFHVFGFTTSTKFKVNAICDSVLHTQAKRFSFHDGVVYAAILVTSEHQAMQQLKPATTTTEHTAFDRDIWQHFLLSGNEVVTDFALLCHSGQCGEISEEAKLLVSMLSLHLRIEISENPVDVPRDASVNVCGSSIYDFHNFRNGLTTPGHENDCTGTYKTDPIQGTSRGTSCQNMMTSDSDNPFHQFFKEESSLEDFLKFSTIPNDKNVNVAQQLHVLDSNLFVTPTFEYEKCRHLFSYRGRIIEGAEISSWLHLSALDNSMLCTMKCEACNVLYKLGMRPDIRKSQRQDITADEGIVTKAAVGRNTEILKNHMNSPVHKIAVIFNQRMQKAGTFFQRKQVLFQLMEAQNRFYLPTKAYLTFVYAQAISGIPFRVHETLTKSLEINGWGFGGVQSTRFAIVSAIESMSTYIRNNFLKDFARDTTPFSVIIDASTDSGNIPYLVVLVQNVVQQEIKIQLYGLLAVKRENSAEMFASVLNQIAMDELEVPGVERKFKEKLVAVASDNAKVMISEGNSMYAKFKKYTGRNIIQQGCANHKLELTFEQALKPDESYLSDFNMTYWSRFFSFYEKHNEFYNFYLSRGNRRWQHLKATCDELEIKCKRFKQYLNIRWAESHYRVLEAISHNTEAIIKDLNHWINVEKAGNNEKFGTALYNTITNLLYALILRDQMDYLGVFRIISLKLEKRSLLVDSYALIEAGVDDLVNLKKEPGAHLSKFVASCSCENKCRVGHCSLKDIETCKKDIKCNKIKYSKNILKLHKFRHEVIEQLCGSFYDYFDIQALKGFQTFDFKQHIYESRHGRYMPSEEEEENFERFCNYVNIPESECLSVYYTKLIEFFNLHGKQIQGLGKEKISDAFFAILSDPKIVLHAKLKDLFEILTVLPTGSAEAERAFSFLNIFKSKRRFSLKPSRLQELLNLKINGPSLSNFDGDAQVQFYIQKHSRTDSFRQKTSGSVKGKTQIPVTQTIAALEDDEYVTVSEEIEY